MGVLHLFPKSGFDQSTTTPVLLGVLLSWAFTETFGWVFAGLVVPGYLAAVFLLDPRAAVIDVIAASFLASPKAYIFLITGAVLAAASNVRYGWDFNGILVPALLSLVIIEPVKFAATFGEVAILLATSAILLKVTPLGRANIEGPRRTVFFFSIDYF